MVAAKVKVPYGDESLPWATLVTAATKFSSKMSSHPIEGSGVPIFDITRDPLTEFTRTVLSIEQTRTEWALAQKMTMLSMLRKFRTRESFDKRGKVDTSPSGLNEASV